jgi:hypothetical protein
VDCGGTRVGTCIDAMAGCRTGKLAYVVVSDGGIAGVGETLRRLPWNGTYMEHDRLLSRIEAEHFAELEELQKDEWPER